MRLLIFMELNIYVLLYFIPQNLESVAIPVHKSDRLNSILRELKKIKELPNEIVPTKRSLRLLNPKLVEPEPEVLSANITDAASLKNASTVDAQNMVAGNSTSTRLQFLPNCTVVKYRRNGRTLPPFYKFKNLKPVSDKWVRLSQIRPEIITTTENTPFKMECIEVQPRMQMGRNIVGPIRYNNCRNSSRDRNRPTKRTLKLFKQQWSPSESSSFDRRLPQPRNCQETIKAFDSPMTQTNVSDSTVSSASQPKPASSTSAATQVNIANASALLNDVKTATINDTMHTTSNQRNNSNMTAEPPNQIVPAPSVTATSTSAPYKKAKTLPAKTVTPMPQVVTSSVTTTPQAVTSLVTTTPQAVTSPVTTTPQITTSPVTLPSASPTTLHPITLPDTNASSAGRAIKATRTRIPTHVKKREHKTTSKAPHQIKNDSMLTIESGYMISHGVADESAEKAGTKRPSEKPVTSPAARVIKVTLAPLHLTTEALKATPTVPHHLTETPKMATHSATEGHKATPTLTQHAKEVHTTKPIAVQLSNAAHSERPQAGRSTDVQKMAPTPAHHPTEAAVPSTTKQPPTTTKAHTTVPSTTKQPSTTTKVHTTVPSTTKQPSTTTKVQTTVPSTTNKQPSTTEARHTTPSTTTVQPSTTERRKIAPTDLPPPPTIKSHKMVPETRKAKNDTSEEIMENGYLVRHGVADDGSWEGKGNGNLRPPKKLELPSIGRSIKASSIHLHTTSEEKKKASVRLHSGKEIEKMAKEAHKANNSPISSQSAGYTIHGAG